MENRPFWNFLLNFAPIKFVCNLSISKKIMQNSFAQKIFNYEMVTYIFYGVATTVINWIAYWLFCELFKIPMKNPSTDDALLSFFANSIAFVIALIFAFVTNKIIVFKSKSTNASVVAKEFISFTVARLFTFALESIILTISTWFSFNLMIAKIFAGVLVVILNYVFSKLFIFKKKEKGVK